MNKVTLALSAAAAVVMLTGAGCASSQQVDVQTTPGSGTVDVQMDGGY